MYHEPGAELEETPAEYTECPKIVNFLIFSRLSTQQGKWLSPMSALRTQCLAPFHSRVSYDIPVLYPPRVLDVRNPTAHSDPPRVTTSHSLQGYLQSILHACIHTVPCTHFAYIHVFEDVRRTRFYHNLFHKTP